MAMKIIKFDTISSTNIYIKEHYQELENLTCVKALHQTDGKGRLGRTWVDRNDLLFSILIKDNLYNPCDYSFLIASSIINVLQDLCPKSKAPLVKWPNDIIINDKKIAGILLEAVTIEKVECVIIGVGINTNTKDFNDELVYKANSLSNILDKEIDNDDLLDQILKQFTIDYYNYINHDKSYKENIMSHFYLMNKEVSFVYDNENYKGIAKGMNENNELIVQTSDEVFNLKSGEVTLTNFYKKLK